MLKLIRKFLIMVKWKTYQKRPFSGPSAEKKLNALGLATNAIVLWNTVYMQAALDHLRSQGEVIKEEDKARLSPLGRKHINFLGHFSFSLPQVVEEGALRALNIAEEQVLA
jgi:hypothetical protein